MTRGRGPAGPGQGDHFGIAGRGASLDKARIVGKSGDRPVVAGRCARRGAGLGDNPPSAPIQHALGTE